MSVRVSRRRCWVESGEKTALPWRTFNLKLVAIADLEERASTKLCKRYKLISRKSFCIRTPEPHCYCRRLPFPRVCKAFNCVFIFHLHHCNRAKSDTKMSFLIKGLSSGGDALEDYQFRCSNSCNIRMDAAGKFSEVRREIWIKSPFTCSFDPQKWLTTHEQLGATKNWE